MLRQLACGEETSATFETGQSPDPASPARGRTLAGDEAAQPFGIMLLAVSRTCGPAGWSGQTRSAQRRPDALTDLLHGQVVAVGR